MSFRWESAEEFLKKKYGQIPSHLSPSAPSLESPPWQSAEDFMSEKGLYPERPLQYTPVEPPKPEPGFDLGRLFGLDDFRRSIEHARAKTAAVSAEPDFPKRITRVGEALEAQMGVIGNAPVIGGAFQALGAIPTALFGGASVASGDPRVARAYIEGSKTLEGDEPAPWDVPAVVRGLGAAQYQARENLGRASEDTSRDMGERALAAAGEKALQFGPFAVPLPGAGRLFRSAPAPQARPAPQLALPAGDVIPMRPPRPEPGPTVTRGSEIDLYRPRLTLDDLRRRTVPPLEGEFRELPPRPVDVPGTRAYRQAHPSAADLGAPLVDASPLATRPRLTLADLQRAVDEASAKMRTPEAPTRPAARVTTDDTLLADLAASVRAKGGTVPEGIGLSVRDRAVHDANEAAIAAFRQSLETGKVSGLRSALQAVADAGGDLAHTAQRIRQATGQGPTAAELSAITRTRVAKQRGLGEMLRESAGESTVEQALTPFADIIVAAAQRVANTRRPASMAELIESGAPRSRILQARERFMEKLRSAPTPYRAVERRSGEWDVVGPAGRGDFPELKPNTAARLNELRVGDRFMHEGFEFEVTSRELSPDALLRELPDGGGVQVRPVLQPDSTVDLKGNVQVIRVANPELPMLRDLPAGTIVEAHAADGRGTVRLQYLGQLGDGGTALVKYADDPGARPVTWGSGDARVRPVGDTFSKWYPEDAFATRKQAEAAAHEHAQWYPGETARVRDQGEKAGRLRYLVEVRKAAPDTIMSRTADPADATARAADLNAASNKSLLRFSGGSSRFLGEDAGAWRAKDALELARRVGTEGGFTYSIEAEAFPSRGFAVSPFKDREFTAPYEPKAAAQQVASYVAKNKDLLAQEGAHLGAWVDESGTLYLDISLVTDTAVRAEEIALTHGQKAYFDLERRASIDVGQGVRTDPAGGVTGGGRTDRSPGGGASGETAEGQGPPRAGLGGDEGSATVDAAKRIAELAGRPLTREDLARARTEAGRLGLNDLRPKDPSTPKSGVGREIYESIRTLKSFIDLPLGRQGIRVIGNPIAFAKGSVESIVAYKRGPDYAKQWLTEKQADANWKKFVDVGGLELTDPTAGSVVGKIGREEMFPGGAIERVPVLGGAIQHSNAAYTHSLNVMRWEKMRSDLRTAEFLWRNLLKRDGPLPDREIRAIAHLANVSTGRGRLGVFTPVGKELGSAFFSPRNTVSWPQFFADWAVAIKDSNHVAAMIHAKSVALYLGFAASVLKATEDKQNPLEWDPRSADFMKVRDGDQRFDVMGGGQQWIVALARVAYGETKGSDKKVRAIDADDIIGSFIMNRAHPAISTIEQGGRLTLEQLHNALQGKRVTGTRKDSYGNEYGYAEVALGALAPIIAEQFIEAIRFEMETEKQFLDAAIDAAISLTGIGGDRYRSGVKIPPMGGRITPTSTPRRAPAPAPTRTPSPYVTPRPVR